MRKVDPRVRGHEDGPAEASEAFEVRVQRVRRETLSFRVEGLTRQEAGAAVRRLLDRHQRFRALRPLAADYYLVEGVWEVQLVREMSPWQEKEWRGRALVQAQGRKSQGA